MTQELVRVGERLLLDPCGILFWPARSALVVADLHLEKGSSAARRGSLAPPYDTRTTLLRLRDVLFRYQPALVVCLGDSFHDPEAADRLPAEDRLALSVLASGRDWVWVSGNHDPDPPRSLPGRGIASLELGPLRFQHEATALEAGVVEVSGHFHPKASVPTRARRVTRPCFVGGSSRIVLPAFGAYTGGLDVLDPLFLRLCPDGFEALILGRDRLFRFQLAAPG